jgi:hypothetical protein
MLSRGGALNPDKLSLDLQFATDKSLTARRGPTPTFTRASTATFVGSNGLIQSAAINAARFDHDPVTLACKGLLIEESRTNFVLNSDLYSTSTPTNITATTITGTSVTGSSQIRELSLTASGAFTGVQTNLTGTGTGTKTLSVFIKKPTSNAAPYFTIGFASSALVYAGIQLTMSGSAPVISVTSTSNTFAVVSSSLETFSNDWYRVSVVVSGTAANCFPTMYPSNAIWDGTSDIRQTLIASGTNLIYIFGAQLEAGSFATSYIPTTTTALTRSADVCSITGSAFTGMYNQSEGTMLVNASTPANGDRTVLATDDNTANEMIRLRTEGTNPFFKVTDGGSEVVAIDAGTVTVNTTFKLAGAYKLDDFAASINGGAAVTDTAGTIPTVDQMRIGAGQGGNTMCGHIAAIRYFKKRLPDAKLVTITT